MKQPFLYVNSFDKDENAYILVIHLTDGNYGDFFYAKDFKPYQED